MSHLPRSRRVMMLVGVVVVLSTLVSTYKSPAERAQLATLEGIDADNNGIRDDVDALIAKQYQESPAQTLYAQRLAVALQATITAPSPNRSQSIKFFQNMDQGIACLRYGTSKENREWVVSRMTKLAFNTPERARKNWSLGWAIAGTSVPAVRREACRE